MKQKKSVITVFFTSFFILVMAMVSAFAWSDDDNEFGFFNRWKDSGYQVDIVKNETYQEECGSCHMAYPAGLLPADSWKKMMGNLAQHFGDNAELDSQTNREILSYLVENSADNSESRLSKKFARVSKNTQVPDRISELPYFLKEHYELPKSIFGKLPELNSFSQCEVCHSRAEAGSFDEHEVKLPGNMYWDD